MLGGFAALGGHLIVLWQPWEFVIICGAAFGTFIIANPVSTIKDTGRAILDVLMGKSTKTEDHLDVLGLIHALMRELRAKGRNELEGHVDNPEESAIFKQYPKVLANTGLLTFICDYMRLIIIGNARPFEIEALMDEEIHTIRHDRLKSYHAMTAVADGVPALRICAARLGVGQAMGALDQSPELLGGLIGAALVGTFLGIFISYGIVTPIANKIKISREKKHRAYIVVKQSLLAFMNGAMPQIAVEHGRKTISSYERPTIDEVENATVSAGVKEAA